MDRRWVPVGLALGLGLVLGIAWATWWQAQPVPGPQLVQAQEAAVEMAALQAEVERLQGLVPGQGHVMTDVAYHFANLWFAGQAGNWPLADFYWSETQEHLHWAVRIQPVIQDDAGQQIKLNDILEAVENTPLAQLRQAIEAQDPERFEAAYRFTLQDGCYACHKAADLPFLRPQIPTQPPEALINFDPQATWPR